MYSVLEPNRWKATFAGGPANAGLGGLGLYGTRAGTVCSFDAYGADVGWPFDCSSFGP